MVWPQIGALKPPVGVHIGRWYSRTVGNSTQTLHNPIRKPQLHNAQAKQQAALACDLWAVPGDLWANLLTQDFAYCVFLPDEVSNF